MKRPYQRRTLSLFFIILLCIGVVTSVCLVLLPYLLSPILQNLVVLEFVTLSLAIGLSASAIVLVSVVPLRGSIQALKQANYERAEYKVRHLPSYMPLLSYLTMYGTVLQAAGRWKDAEPVFFEALAEVQHQIPKLQSVVLCVLAETLDELGRHDEAERYNRGALEMWPEGDIPYLMMALHTVRLELDPEIVESWYNAISGFGPRPLVNYLLQRYTWAAKHAQKAVIASYLGHHVEANQLMAVAFANADRSYKPGMAALYVMQGEILSRQNQHTEAQAAWQKAAELDPDGMAGMNASKALKQHSIN